MLKKFKIGQCLQLEWRLTAKVSFRIFFRKGPPWETLSICIFSSYYYLILLKCLLPTLFLRPKDLESFEPVCTILHSMLFGRFCLNLLFNLLISDSPSVPRKGSCKIKVSFSSSFVWISSSLVGLFSSFLEKLESSILI